MGEFDLQQIVHRYQRYFDGKRCVIKTNYKSLSNFSVFFCISDLHHLLGLHKLLKLTATQTIPKIIDGTLNLDDLRKNKNFHDVKDRIENYNFIEEVFIGNRCPCCILKKDILNNKMNLSVVFYKEEQKKYVILGLKKDKKRDLYIPATLHTSRNNKYDSYRKTQFSIIEWI